MADPPVRVCARQMPTGVSLSKNWTVPVGVPAPGGWALTVAVNVTGCPTTADAGAAVTCGSASASTTFQFTR